VLVKGRCYGWFTFDPTMNRPAADSYGGNVPISGATTSESTVRLCNSPRAHQVAPR